MKRLGFSGNIITLRRLIKSGFSNLFRNAWLATAATAIMVVTLSVVSLGIIFSMSLTETIEEQITNEVALEVFLVDGSAEAKQIALRRALEADPNVKTVEYISKDQAVEEYIADNKDDPVLLAGLTDFAIDLPASYRASLFDLTLIDDAIGIAEQAQFDDVVDDLNFDDDRKESIERIASWQDFIIASSIVAGIIFAAISILIIFNTIRMAIFTRSYEIEIMKVIGATPGYIRGPFLIEAAMYGIVAGIITLGLLYLLVIRVMTPSDEFLEFDRVRELFTGSWYAVVIFVLGLGLLIGFVSAIFAMSKYLRVKRW